MADINLSKAVRTNLGSLQNTASLMAKTQERLSTGNKVNSALDNPTNFFTASALNSRASDLNNLMDSMANGIKTIEAADNGLKAITKNLESMQSTLRQAQQDKSFKAESFALDATTVGTTGTRNLSFSGGAFDTAVTVDLQKSAQTGDEGFGGVGGVAGRAGTIELTATSLNGGDPLSVNFAADDTVETTVEKINQALGGLASGNGGISAKVQDGQIKLTSLKGETITVAGDNEQYVGFGTGSVTGQNAQTAAPAGGTDMDTDATVLTGLIGKSISIKAENGEELNYTIGSTDNTVADLKAALTDNGFTASTTDAGLQITRTDGVNFTVDFASGADATLFGFAAASTTTTNGIIDSASVTTPTTGKEVKGVDELVNEINSNADIAGKVRASNDNGKIRFENLSTKALDIAGLSKTAGVTGITTGATAAEALVAGNEVRADLAKQYNELRDQLDKMSDDASFNGINLLRIDNLKLTFNETGTSSIEILSKNGEAVNSANLGLETTIESSDLDSDTDITVLLDSVKGALNAVRSQASSFGSNLSVVQNRQDFTQSMIDTLETGAGNLTLADMNAEAANMMALQTRQSIGSSTLSMANQADQGVLQLLR
ncbi:MAG TPA: flagellin [Devosia sp.]|nr:flagellin [Devosia sp.]